MKSERDFKNYLAGAALAFGVVLLTSEMLKIIYGSVSTEESNSLNGFIQNIFYISNLVGGILGGYLVARVRQTDFIQTGTVTAVLAYIFEFIYFLIVEGVIINIYTAFSLILGGIIGAMFYRARTERERVLAKKPTEKPREPEKK